MTTKTSKSSSNIDILEPCTPVSNKDEATSHGAVTSSIWKPCSQQMVFVQSVHCKNNQNKVLICIHFWKPTCNVWKILVSTRKTSRWPHNFRLQPLVFRKYMASICSFKSIAHHAQLAISWFVLSNSVRCSPPRANRLQLYLDYMCLASRLLTLKWSWFLVTSRWLYHEVFHYRCLSKWRVYCWGWRNTTGTAMSPRSRIAITTQRKVEGHNKCEAIDAS